MMNYGSIYILIFPNNKIYIGQTNNFNKRMTSYPAHGRSKHDAVANAIRSFGWANVIKKEILRAELNQLDYYEMELIKKYNSMNKSIGYNLESGGKKNKTISEELRQKLITSHLGIGHTQETKQKISDALKLRVRKPETYKKIADKLRGHGFSKESIAKMSATKKLNYSLELYKIHNIRPVIAINPITKEETFFVSGAEASRKIKGDNRNINSCLTGKRKMAYGYMWRYAERSVA